MHKGINPFAGVDPFMVCGQNESYPCGVDSCHSPPINLHFGQSQSPGVQEGVPET